MLGVQRGAVPCWVYNEERRYPAHQRGDATRHINEEQYCTQGPRGAVTPVHQRGAVTPVHQRGAVLYPRWCNEERWYRGDTLGRGGTGVGYTLGTPLGTICHSCSSDPSTPWVYPASRCQSCTTWLATMLHSVPANGSLGSVLKLYPG